MYYLECQCKFRNVWNEIEGLHPYGRFQDAIYAANFFTSTRRTPVRVVDDSGQVVYMAGA
jgi:hypothetical protein